MVGIVVVQAEDVSLPRKIIEATITVNDNVEAVDAPFALAILASIYAKV